METFLLVSHIALWAVALFLAFLLLGTLRAYGVLRWQLAQLEATTPNRVGRSGLKPGRPAPDFTLPDVSGREVSLGDFAGKPLLLVFVQAGCGPCHAVAPELNAVARRGQFRVAVINHADPDAARAWARDVAAEFPVLIQENWAVSKRYEAYATPFAFVIGPDGVVRSSGIAGTREHLGYVLGGANNEPVPDHSGAARRAAETGGTAEAALVEG